MTFLLDTYACIHFLNRTHPDLVRRVVAVGPGRVAVSSVTVAELEYGAARSSRPGANRDRLRSFLEELPVHPFDASCAARFGAVKATLVAHGSPIPDFNIAIAATALTLGFGVVSGDRHFGVVPGLVVEDWSR